MFLRAIYTLFLLLLAAGAFIFVALNPERVAIEFAFLRTTAGLGLALIVAAALGMVVGVLWRGNWVAQLRAERGRLRRAVRLAEARARDSAMKVDGKTVDRAGRADV